MTPHTERRERTALQSVQTPLPPPPQPFPMLQQNQSHNQPSSNDDPFIVSPESSAQALDRLRNAVQNIRLQAPPVPQRAFSQVPLGTDAVAQLREQANAAMSRIQDTTAQRRSRRNPPVSDQVPHGAQPPQLQQRANEATNQGQETGVHLQRQVQFDNSGRRHPLSDFDTRFMPPVQDNFPQHESALHSEGGLARLPGQPRARWSAGQET